MPHEYQTTGESTAFLTGGIYGLPVFDRTDQAVKAMERTGDCS